MRRCVCSAIAPEFLDRVRSMVRFRNRAVHLYADIDVAFIELIVARYFA